MISGKIDVMKIEKARLFKGEKGTYLDILLIPTPNGKNGDYMIVQSISKEERDAGKKAPIIGNGKIIGAAPSQQSSSTPASNSYTSESDLPF